VTPYLEEATVLGTLRFIGALAGRSEVVFDYANPVQSLSSEEGRAQHEELAARVAAIGEQFKSWLDSDALAATLRQIGFVTVEDLGPRAIAARFFGVQSTRGDRGGHMVHAAR
jgi:O-methyltransferase involved in polyketide biosynthesis